MQNQNIIQLIDNLKGRRSYEEKKATKLGFPSLYDYFEDKVLKEKQMIEDKKKELDEIKKNNNVKNKENKSCSCC